MVIIPTLQEFLHRTVPLVDYEFEDADIVPDTITGDFRADRLAELQDFCRQNPEYHIISIIDACLYFNKIVCYAQDFHLAQGDSNPDLVCFENHRFRKFFHKNSSDTKDSA